MDHEVETTLTFTVPLLMMSTKPQTPTVTMSCTQPLTAMNTNPLLYLSDEKWFYGLVARTFAKACESLGTTLLRIRVKAIAHSPMFHDLVNVGLMLTTETLLCDT